METAQIASKVGECSRNFSKVIKGLEENQSFAAQLSPAALKDEFDRFKLWIGNIAAHRKGQRSLDYRLRDSIYLRDRVLELLASMQGALSDGIL